MKLASILWPIHWAIVTHLTRSWWSITAWGHWAPFSVAEMLALKLMMVTFKDGSCSLLVAVAWIELYFLIWNTRWNQHLFHNVFKYLPRYIYICINKIHINIYFRLQLGNLWKEKTCRDMLLNTAEPWSSPLNSCNFGVPPSSDRPSECCTLVSPACWVQKWRSSPLNIHN